MDSSPYGVRILTPIPLVPGQVIEYSTPDDLDHSVQCLVKWMGRKDTDLAGLAGLEFLTPLAKSE